MQTVIGVGDPKAVRRYAVGLATDTEKQSYFAGRFIGEGENNVIEKKIDLEQDAGDRISFDLSMRLQGEGVDGDDNVEGTEENLTFYTDEVRIDQKRKGVDAGGRMSRKRTIHNLRDTAKARGSEWAAEWFDELIFVYLSGTLDAVNEDRKVTKAFAGNPVEAPDRFHMVYGGAATSKATLTASDKMTRALVDRLSTKPRMMNSENPNVVKMSPITVDGTGKHFILLMSPYQSFDMRNETGETSWAAVQRAAAAAEGRNNPLFKGSLGMVSNVVLHEHENVRRFRDYGAGANIEAARALFMGRQAGVLAYGEGGNKTRFSWEEELKDAKNRVSFYIGTITGFKKARFNGLDFGVVAVDTASTNPNPAIAA